MDSSLITWIIGGIAVAIALTLFNVLFRSLGFIIKLVVTIGVLVFFFGWASVAQIPSKIWDGIKSVGNTSVDVKINGVPVSCAIIPTVDEGKKIVESLTPTINQIIGAISQDITVSIKENPKCPGKSTVIIASKTLDQANKAKSDLQKILPSLPIEVEQK